MGADSLCIKDMAGIISPYDAYELVAALKKALIPIHLHTHYTSGMASMASEGYRGRGGRIDTCVAPFATQTPILRSSRLLLRSPGRSATRVRPDEIPRDQRVPGGHHREVYAVTDTTKFSVIDIGVLMHQIPAA